MAKEIWKPGNMLYPLPAVLVTVRDRAGKDNVFTVAWAGTVCTNPPMLSISVRPERHSYKALHETGEFVVNLATEDMVKAVEKDPEKKAEPVKQAEKAPEKKDEPVKSAEKASSVVPASSIR